MYFDGINLAEGSVVSNLTVASGADFPANATLGELFYLTAGSVGLYIYDGSNWNKTANDAEFSSLSSVPFVIKTADASVPNALVLGSLSAGFVKNPGSTGVLSTVGSIDLSSSDVSGILAAARFPALSGDLTSTAGSTVISLANTGVAAGTYNKLTVDAKGRVTSAVQATTLSALGITDAAALTGSNTTDFAARHLTVSGDILPEADGVQNIGSAALRWSTIWVNEAKLSTNTLYIGDTPILGTQGDTIKIKADPGQSIHMLTTTTGSTLITSENQVQISTAGMNADVLVQATGTGSKVRLGATSAVEFTAPTTSIFGDASVSGNETVGGNLTVTGNLTVNGTNTIVNSATVTTKDNIILVNYGEVGSGVTAGRAGIQVDRGDMADYQMVFDETDDMFKVGQVGNLETIASQNYVASYAAPVAHVGSGGAAHAVATGSLAGFMSSSDKSKLDGIAAGANAYVHPTSGAVAGTYSKVTVNANGHVTSGASLVAADIPSLDWSKLTSGKPTTLGGYGITDAVSANVAITAGTYAKVTVDTKGLVTAGTSLVAADIPSLDWSKISTGKPTTLAGYGIADAYTKTETDNRIQAVVGAAPAALDTLAEIASQLANDESAVSALTTTVAGKLDSSEVVTTATASKVLRLDSTGKLPASITGNAATATNVVWSGVTSTPTTVSGYGITNAYTKTEVDSAISTAVSGVQSGNVATASTAAKLTTARTIGMTGDVTWSVSFDGSANVSAAGTLANSGVTAGTYPKVTVNAKGLVTAGTSLVAADIPSLDWSKISTGKPTSISGYGITIVASDIPTLDWSKISSASLPTTLAGYGITDAQALDADLTAIAALAGTSGFLKKTAANTWSLDTATYLTANQTVTVSGDATGSGTTAIALTLANTGVTAGTYKSVTVNAKGLVTGGTNPTTLAGYGITDAAPISHSNDATIHLTTAQDTWINAITATAAEVNYLSGVSSSIQTQLNGKQASLGFTAENSANKGVANGYAGLGADGKVPAAQLPSYVDDVIEGTNLAAFPATGATGVIYVALDTNKIYRWTGTVYIEISPTVGNSDTATKLATARSIAMTGDVSWTIPSFDGSANVTAAGTLATITDSGTGTFKKITTNSKGLVTGTAAVAQADITGLLGAGSITNTMLANAAVASLSGTNTGDETLATIKTKLGITTLSGSNTGDQTITLTGDATGSGTGSFAVTLANSGVTAGTYPKVTVDAKGRVTGGTTLVAADIPALDWSKITSGKPTSISGYGITDAYDKTYIDAMVVDGGTF